MKILLLSIFTILSIQCKEAQTSETLNATNLNEGQETAIQILNKSDFKKAIAGQNVQLVDVRTPEEFSEGFIEGAININIYDKTFADKISKLDKSKPVYVYCRSGARSQSAAKQMQQLGFTSIIDLKGGYLNY